MSATPFNVFPYGRGGMNKPKKQTPGDTYWERNALLELEKLRRQQLHEMQMEMARQRMRDEQARREATMQGQRLKYGLASTALANKYDPSGILSGGDEPGAQKPRYVNPTGGALSDAEAAYQQKMGVRVGTPYEAEDRKKYAERQEVLKRQTALKPKPVGTIRYVGPEGESYTGPGPVMAQTPEQAQQYAGAMAASRKRFSEYAQRNAVPERPGGGVGAPTTGGPRPMLSELLGRGRGPAPNGQPTAQYEGSPFGRRPTAPALGSPEEANLFGQAAGTALSSNALSPQNQVRMEDMAGGNFRYSQAPLDAARTNAEAIFQRNEAMRKELEGDMRVPQAVPLPGDLGPLAFYPPPNMGMGTGVDGSATPMPMPTTPQQPPGELPNPQPVQLPNVDRQTIADRLREIGIVEPGREAGGTPQQTAAFTASPQYQDAERRFREASNRIDFARTPEEKNQAIMDRSAAMRDMQGLRAETGAAASQTRPTIPIDIGGQNVDIANRYYGIDPNTQRAIEETRRQVLAAGQMSPQMQYFRDTNARLAAAGLPLITQAQTGSIGAMTPEQVASEQASLQQRVAALQPAIPGPETAGGGMFRRIPLTPQEQEMQDLARRDASAQVRLREKQAGIGGPAPEQLQASANTWASGLTFPDLKLPGLWRGVASSTPVGGLVGIPITKLAIDRAKSGADALKASIQAALSKAATPGERASIADAIVSQAGRKKEYDALIAQRNALRDAGWSDRAARGMLYPGAGDIVDGIVKTVDEIERMLIDAAKGAAPTMLPNQTAAAPR